MEGRYGHGGALCPFGFFPGRHGTPTGFRAQGSRIVGARPLFLDQKSLSTGYVMI